MSEQQQRPPRAAVMTPDHPRWVEFYDRLAGPEGCDFRDEDGRTTWQCAGGRDQTFARAILERMSVETPDEPLDVAGSLTFFSMRGGHCDCEIIFNVGSGDG